MSISIEQQCEWCDEEESELENSNGELLCEDCFDRYMDRCVKCKEIKDLNQHFLIDDRSWCLRCLSDRTGIDIDNEGWINTQPDTYACVANTMNQMISILRTHGDQRCTKDVTCAKCNEKKGCEECLFICNTCEKYYFCKDCLDDVAYCETCGNFCRDAHMIVIVIVNNIKKN